MFFQISVDTTSVRRILYAGLLKSDADGIVEQKRIGGVGHVYARRVGGHVATAGLHALLWRSVESIFIPPVCLRVMVSFQLQVFNL